MADAFQRLIERVARDHARTPTPLQFHAAVSPEWSTRAPAGRDALYQDCARALRLNADEAQYLTQKPKGVRPDLARWCLTISHTDDLGGWAVVASPHVIGLDIEIRARVAPATIARVSLPAELAEAPEPTYLWAAKEACLKSLTPDGQVLVLSQIVIGGWRHEDGVYLFNSRTRDAGYLTADDRHMYAIFLSAR